MTRNRPILPPTRQGVGKAYISLEYLYTFETTISASDVVAHVKIGDWLKEDDDHTYYETEIIELFKGENISSIILMQDGCSQWTINNYPLFTSGNELLLFLKKATGTEFDNAYFIRGSYSTVMYAVTSSEGSVYYLDRYNILSSSAEGIINNIPQDSFARELYEKVIKEDPVLGSHMSVFEHLYFYSREDFLTLIP